MALHVQSVAPPSAKEPAGHEAQDELLLVALYVLAGQAVWMDDPAPLPVQRKRGQRPVRCWLGPDQSTLWGRTRAHAVAAKRAGRAAAAVCVSSNPKDTPSGIRVSARRFAANRRANVAVDAPSPRRRPAPRSRVVPVQGAELVVPSAEKKPATHEHELAPPSLTLLPGHCAQDAWPLVDVNVLVPHAARAWTARSPASSVHLRAALGQQGRAKPPRRFFAVSTARRQRTRAEAVRARRASRAAAAAYVRRPQRTTTDAWSPASSGHWTPHTAADDGGGGILPHGHPSTRSYLSMPWSWRGRCCCSSWPSTGTRRRCRRCCCCPGTTRTTPDRPLP